MSIKRLPEQKMFIYPSIVFQHWAYISHNEVSFWNSDSKWMLFSLIIGLLYHFKNKESIVTVNKFRYNVSDGSRHIELVGKLLPHFHNDIWISVRQWCFVWLFSRCVCVKVIRLGHYFPRFEVKIDYQALAQHFAGCYEILISWLAIIIKTDVS